MSEKVIEENYISPSSPSDVPEHHDTIGRRKSLDDVIYNAQRATEKEHRMSLWQGIKLYPKAVAWSMLISTCICMEGYDVCLLSNFCEFTFSKHNLWHTTGV
jgi:MFS transporter, SP family, general alpha glucoside:H+ symporter